MAYFTVLLRYIHQNPVKAGIVEKVKDYEYSSWGEYDGTVEPVFQICDTRTVLNRIPFKDLEEWVNDLLDFVNILQEELLRAGVLPKDYDFEAHKELVPMQPGDVPTTYADATALERDFGFTPKITLREGLRKFAEWYKEYYG